MTRIVVCPEPLAAEAGAEIFRLGGSAVDAAIAAAYAQTVIAPEMATIGGTGVLEVFDAPTGRTELVDFLGYAGSGASEAMYAGAPANAHFHGYPMPRHKYDSREKDSEKDKSPPTPSSPSSPAPPAP